MTDQRRAAIFDIIALFVVLTVFGYALISYGLQSSRLPLMLLLEVEQYSRAASFILAAIMLYAIFRIDLIGRAVAGTAIKAVSAILKVAFTVVQRRFLA